MKSLSIPDLKISDLKTSRGVNNFKNNFSLQSDEFKNSDPDQRINPKFTGKVCLTDMNGIETEYEYNKDYFKPAVLKLATNYLKALKIESEVIYATDARINFLKGKVLEIQKVINTYRKAKHLNSTDVVLIISELEKLSDKLSEMIQGLVLLAKDKITFNMNKNQVLMLFKLLHEQGLIKGLSIYDLMHFVEKHVNFKNHQEIKNANKSLNTEIARLDKSASGKYQLDDQALLDLINNILKI